MRLLLAVGFLAQCAISVTAICYAPDGSEKTASSIAPCSNDPSDPLSNVCCNLIRPKAPGTSTNASEVRDTCLPNGLCQNMSLLKDGSLYLQWGRDFCTNRDWSTGQCLDNVCTNTAKGRRGFQRVVPCTGKNTSITWCCGDSDDCCTSDDQTNLVSLSPTFTTAVVSTSSTSPSTATTVQTLSSISNAEQTPTSTSAISPAVTSRPSNNANPSAGTQNTGLSGGAKAGIAIGSIVGAVLLVALGVWISKALVWRRNALAAKVHNSPGYYTPGSNVEGSYGQHPQKYAYYAEADATPRPTEVLATPDPVEAPDTQVNFHNVHHTP